MRGCKIFVALFAVLYAAAVFIMLTGLYGWFGQEKDPLSAVFLVPLGLPWNVLGDLTGFMGPSLALLAPAINLGLLVMLCRRRRA